MKWHVIGSTGYIGRHLIEALPNQTVLGYARACKNHRLDLSDFHPADMPFVAEGDFVAVLAANSSPDACQNRYAEAYEVNVIGTKKLISHCLEHGARVLFFSSDTVIGATESAKDENAEAHPVGNYGKMKREVEEAFFGREGFKVFRLSYVFSKEDKFMQYLLRCHTERVEAEVYRALFRNVIYLDDVIEAVIRLEETFHHWDNTVFHLCGEECLSREDLAHIFWQEIVADFNYIVSVPEKAFFEARPNRIEISSLYLHKLLGRTPCRIRDAMRIELLGKEKQNED